MTASREHAVLCAASAKVAALMTVHQVLWLPCLEQPTVVDLDVVRSATQQADSGVRFTVPT